MLRVDKLATLEKWSGRERAVACSCHIQWFGYLLRARTFETTKVYRSTVSTIFSAYYISEKDVLRTGSVIIKTSSIYICSTSDNIKIKDRRWLTRLNTDRRMFCGWQSSYSGHHQAANSAARGPKCKGRSPLEHLSGNAKADTYH